jgi:tRNA pseudouridine55 synthase
MYAALHHQGRRLHELARSGIVVERAARAVTIEQLDILDWSPPVLVVDVMCSKGTYIRSLARDLGQVFGCGGHLQALRRTAVGTFLIEQATPLSQLEAERFDIMSILLPPELAVTDWPAVQLTVEMASQVRNGQSIAIEGLDAERARAQNPDGSLLALLTRVGTIWKPEKVFDWTA